MSVSAKYRFHLDIVTLTLQAPYLLEKLQLLRSCILLKSHYLLIVLGFHFHVIILLYNLAVFKIVLPVSRLSPKMI